MRILGTIGTLALLTLSVGMGCRAASKSTPPNTNVSERSGTTTNQTNSRNNPNSGGGGAEEILVIADPGTYPFPINKSARLNGLPLPFDNKDWGKPDPATAEAIASFAQADGTYATDCNNGEIKLVLVEDGVTIAQTASFSESNCNTISLLSTLNYVVRGMKIAKTGSTFDLTGSVVDIFISPKSSSTTSQFNSEKKCGISQWILNQNQSVAGETCNGKTYPAQGSIVSQKMTFTDTSLTTADGTVYSKLPPAMAITGGSQISVSTSMLAFVTVSLMNNNTPFCSGTLISESHVVTAAHCIEAAESIPSANLSVGFGVTGATKVKVLSLKKHENYTDQNLDSEFTPALNADVGIVKLAGPVPKPYRSIALLPSTENLAANEKVYIAGFGVDETGNAGVLKASFSLFSAENSVSQNFKTVSSVTQSTCNGDSGGPAFVVRGNYYYLIGATSYGPSNFYCRGGDSFFADLRRFSSWLEANAN